MERLNFKIEFADNGVVVKDCNHDFMIVYEGNESEEPSEYTKRAISDSIADTITKLLLSGYNNLEPKDIYKIKIEIR